MATQIVPNPDDAAAKSLVGSIQALKANAALYGVTPEELTALEAKATVFASELSNVESAKNAQNGAVARKDEARMALEKDYRNLVARIHTNRAVTDDHKIAAGIPPRDMVRSVLVPPAPTDLVVAPNANGTNYLAWNCFNAPPGTDYLIESRATGSDSWVLIAAVSRLTYQHNGQKPGVGIFYRVRSRRSKLESQPCIPVGAYL